jgi:hypothetical protein
VSVKDDQYLDHFDKNYQHDFDIIRHQNVSSEYSTTSVSGSLVPLGLSARTVSNIRRPEGNQDASSEATDSSGAGSRYKVFIG